MTYEQFKITYTDAFNRMMTYKPTEVGSGVYAEKLAALSDEYPEFESRLENEV